MNCDEVLQLLQSTHPEAAIIGGVVQGEWMFRSYAHKVEFIQNGIISEVRLETTYLESAVASTVDMAVTELAPKLASPPSVGVMFATHEMFNNSQERNSAMKKLVCSLPPAIHLVGSSVDTLVGTCPSGQLSVRRDEGVALSLGSFPEAEVSSFAVKRGDDIAAELKKQGDRARCLLELRVCDASRECTNARLHCCIRSLFPSDANSQRPTLLCQGGGGVSSEPQQKGRTCNDRRTGAYGRFAKR